MTDSTRFFDDDDSCECLMIQIRFCHDDYSGIFCTPEYILRTYNMDPYTQYTVYIQYIYNVDE